MATELTGAHRLGKWNGGIWSRVPTVAPTGCFIKSSVSHLWGCPITRFFLPFFLPRLLFAQIWDLLMKVGKKKPDMWWDPKNVRLLFALFLPTFLVQKMSGFFLPFFSPIYLDKKMSGFFLPTFKTGRKEAWAKRSLGKKICGRLLFAHFQNWAKRSLGKKKPGQKEAWAKKSVSTERPTITLLTSEFSPKTCRAAGETSGFLLYSWLLADEWSNVKWPLSLDKHSAL